MDLYIYHHLGLGDHIICNGLVRNLIKGKDKSYLFVKKHNLKTVQFMYRDLNRVLYFIEVNDDTDVDRFLKNIPIKQQIKIGFEYLYENKGFDQQFYEQVNIDFNKRFTDFFVERDLKKELELFNSVKYKQNNYNIIHEDINRNFKIDRKYITNNLPNISINENIKTDVLFDLITLFENANEIHMIESSPFLLIDSIESIKNPKLLLYRKTRPEFYSGKINEPTRKKNWIIND